MRKQKRTRWLIAGPAALFGVAILIGSVLFMSSGKAHGETALVSTSPADIAAGSVLFANHCQSCHGYQGSGGDVGAPALTNAGAAAADFYLTTGRMPLASPSEEAVRHRPYFNNTQISQLVAYINALPQITKTYQAGPAVPTVAPLCPTATAPTPNPTGCVTLSEGEALFALNCAECHQAAGSGAVLSKGNIVPGLGNASITQTVEAIRVGPRPMPVFGPNELSNSQISAIAQYVQYLHHPNNSGGLPVSHFGPIAEGFVGILLGFVVLWFTARMIGTRG